MIETVITYRLSLQLDFPHLHPTLPCSGRQSRGSDRRADRQTEIEKGGGRERERLKLTERQIYTGTQKDTQTERDKGAE